MDDEFYGDEMINHGFSKIRILQLSDIREPRNKPN